MYITSPRQLPDLPSNTLKSLITNQREWKLEKITLKAGDDYPASYLLTYTFKFANCEYDGWFLDQFGNTLPEGHFHGNYWNKMAKEQCERIETREEVKFLIDFENLKRNVRK